MALLSARLNIGRLNAERLHWIGADTVAPGAPINLAATPAATTIALTWTAATDYYGIARYWIEGCSGAGCTNFTYIGNTTGLAFTATNLSPLSTYRFRVRAEDPTGNLGPYSNIVTATTTDRPALTNIYLFVNGAWTLVNQYARVEGATVTQGLNEVVDTASITFSGAVPYALKGLQISINDQANATQFAGNITAVRTIYEGRAKNVAYECDALDWTWLLNSRKVTTRYTATAIAAIVQSLVTNFAPAGFTVDTSGIINNLTIDEITYTNEELAQCLSRVCERGGLYWYADYQRVVRAFNSSAVPSAGTIDQTHPRQSAKLTLRDDLAAVATRIVARGGGAGATSDAAVGQTTLPVDDAAWYSASGGMVECGPQRLTYTGVVGASETGSTLGKIGAPPANANYWAPGQSGTGILVAGNYLCGVTNVTPEGETLLGPLTSVTVPTNGNIMIGITIANVPTDPKIKAFRAYVGTANGDASTMRMIRYDNLGANVANSYGVRWDGPAGYFLYTDPVNRTTTPAPTANTAGDGSVTVPPGSTSLAVDDLAPFPASGWAEGPGGQLIRYTGKSASSGPGSLTGIPASGIGSITAALRSGTIRSIPHLTGIPASGAGAVLYPIKAGDQVLIMVIRFDQAAINALAAATGGDGIREEFLTDGRLALAELTARADATLGMRKQSLATVNFETRDPAVVVGKTITFNTTQPPIVGTFLIQRVVISQFQARGSIGHPNPLRVVEASSRRYTFDDLVQQIKLLGRIN